MMAPPDLLRDRGTHSPRLQDNGWKLYHEAYCWSRQSELINLPAWFLTTAAHSALQQSVQFFSQT